jgi:hypothetical protein
MDSPGLSEAEGFANAARLASLVSRGSFATLTERSASSLTEFERSENEGSGLVGKERSRSPRACYAGYGKP